jgi:hypothetical protein
MIRRRVDKYGELNDSELAEREQRRHEADDMNGASVSKEHFASCYAIEPSPFTDAWLARTQAKLEDKAAKLAAWIERMQGQACCGDGGPDERGYCSQGPHLGGTKCPLLFWMDVYLASGAYVPDYLRKGRDGTRNESSGSEEGHRERDSVEGVCPADQPSGGEVD